MPSSLQSKRLAQVKPATHNATAPMAMIAAVYRRAVTESIDEYRQRSVPPLPPRRSSLKCHSPDAGPRRVLLLGGPRRGDASDSLWP